MAIITVLFWWNRSGARYSSKFSLYQVMTVGSFDCCIYTKFIFLYVWKRNMIIYVPIFLMLIMLYWPTLNCLQRNWVFLEFVTTDWDILFRQLDLLRDNTPASSSSYPPSVSQDVNQSQGWRFKLCPIRVRAISFTETSFYASQKHLKKSGWEEHKMWE